MVAKVLLLSAYLALAALVVLAFGQSQRVGQAFQERILVGIDANPAGNTATSLGSIETCVSVKSGQTFDVDVFVRNIRELGLGAWQTTVEFDPTVLRVVAYDIQLFLATEPGADLVDLSDPVPSETGAYLLAVADFASDPGESGEGVLGRLTLEATSAGSSDLQPEGIVLVNTAGGSEEDLNHDSIYDGATAGAVVSVDAPCPEPAATLTPQPSPATPTPTSAAPAATPATPISTPVAASPVPPAVGDAQDPSSADEDGGFPWPVVGGVAGGVAAIVMLSFVFGWRLRRARYTK